MSSAIWGPTRQPQSRETYRRAHRAFPTGPGKLFIPATEYLQPALSDVHVVIDTSGSMDDDALASGLGEIDRILRTAAKATPGAKINCNAVYASVAEHHVVRNLREARAMLRGGGGTDMMVGIKAAAAQHRKKPRRGRSKEPNIVVLTNGYTHWDNVKPEGAGNVVVCMIGEGHATADEGPKWSTVIECDNP